ncbi:hypothetical protein BDQ12DRAFT_658877 [Crucibulum laeve]|uniref:NADH:flavin oxidoreductase/NADH oxidase N-terminal domain-containing protein n=1 Tax=Crucibulum laeve TaxID=68775 RepID=A0A5C3LKA9_9AGAR|nr:hypothetical protein BDQ12DRAFT_658877 [Crucibulum laeve]
MSTPKLFQPIELGKVTLQHRVVLAPLTRFRATKLNHLPVVPLVKEYYTQRSKTPGTLLISEGTGISVKAGGYVNAPGIFSVEQLKAWKEVTDAVHANNSFIYAQIWAAGRSSVVAGPEALKAEGITVVAPSSIPLSSHPTQTPHELTIEEIHEYVEMFAEAAKKAVFEAGFDGIEIHGANGYLIDEFIQDVSNQRTDAYGGSIENRNRFPLEIVDAVVRAVGQERVAFRVSPWSTFQDMRMKDPVPQFSHLVTALRDAYPSLAYLHAIEPRIGGDSDKDKMDNHESNDFIRNIWSPKRLVSAGGFTRDSAIKHAEETGDLIAFGRYYISNPDLPSRLLKNVPLEKYNRATFYVPGESESAAVGYIDYPFAE